MGCYDMLEADAIELGEQTRRSSILKMAETPSYPSLQAFRIITVCQHLSIVVAFQHKSVAVTQDRFDMRSRATRISQYAQPQCAISKHKLCGFLCIMRDRVRLYLNIPDGKTLVTLYDIDR